MKTRIEGFYDFQNGDELKVNKEVKAVVNQQGTSIFLEFKDTMGTNMYIGDIKKDTSSHIDDLINVVWTTLSLKW